MKKLLVSLLLSAVFALAASAQDNSFNKSVSLSIGGMTGLEAEGFFINNEDPYSLTGIYEPRWDNVIDLPVFGLDGDWILGRWIGLSLSLSYSGIKAEKIDMSEGSMGFSQVRQLCLVPGFKAYWANRERFKLYSGFDIGAQARWMKDEGKTSFGISPAWDFVPIGARFKFLDGFGLFAFAELMTGRRVLGTRFGVGFAF